MPRVSVVIPTFNRLSTLPRAIASVEAQSFRDWELLVVDDGSTDGTGDWLHQHPLFSGEAARGRVLVSPQLGVSRARNLGILHSHGEWLAFLDSDDEWLADKLLCQLNLAGQLQVPLIHANEIWIRNGVRVNECKHHAKGGGRIFSQGVPRCVISPSAALLRRDLLSTVGLFNEAFPVCEDYELWLRITSEFDVGFVETPLIRKFGGHADQLSRRYHAMDYWRVKALLPWVDSHRLTEGERQLVKQTIKKKCEILVKGYERHDNRENLAEIREVLQLF
ncbi:MAG: glycosyltransferase [Bdellovibrionales bacterium]|nr:glycosyltransferase [Bdellovibrionales bacterium]